MSLPSAIGRRAAAGGVDVGLQQLAQIDGGAALVGQLDADHVAAGHDGHAHRQRAQRAGDVVGEADDARRTGAGRRLQLVEGDHRPGLGVDDLAAHAEIVEHGLELARGLGQGLGRFAGAGDRLDRRQQVEARQLEAGVQRCRQRLGRGCRLARRGRRRPLGRARSAAAGRRRPAPRLPPSAASITSLRRARRTAGSTSSSASSGAGSPGRRRRARSMPRMPSRTSRPEVSVAAPAASPSRRPTQSEPAASLPAAQMPSAQRTPSAVKQTSTATTRLAAAKPRRAEPGLEPAPLQVADRPAQPRAQRPGIRRQRRQDGEERGQCQERQRQAEDRQPGPGERPAQHQPHAPAHGHQHGQPGREAEQLVEQVGRIGAERAGRVAHQLRGWPGSRRGRASRSPKGPRPGRSAMARSRMPPSRRRLPRSRVRKGAPAKASAVDAAIGLSSVRGSCGCQHLAEAAERGVDQRRLVDQRHADVGGAGVRRLASPTER